MVSRAVPLIIVLVIAGGSLVLVLSQLNPAKSDGTSSTSSVTLTSSSCLSGQSCLTVTTASASSSTSTSSSTSSHTTGVSSSSTSFTSSVGSNTTVSSTTPSTTSTTTATSQSSSTSASTSTAQTTTQASTGTIGTLSFVFLNASAAYDSKSGQTTIQVALRDTGSINILPKTILDVVPDGTSLVSGSWTGNFYSSGGTYICSVPHQCSGGPPDTSNGGTIIVTFAVTGATPGEVLTLTYTITESGLTASGSVNITVA